MRRRRAGRAGRIVCALLGALGLGTLGYDFVLDVVHGPSWHDAVRFILLGSATYLFLHIAVTGELPSWLDL